MSDQHPPPGPYGGQERQPPPHGQPYGGPSQGSGWQQGRPGDPYSGQQQPQQGWGQQQDPTGHGDYQAYVAYQDQKTPGAVLAAAIMTYLGSVFTLLGGIAVAAVGGAAPARLLESVPGALQLPGDALTVMRTILVAFGVFLILWSVLVLVLALFAQKGRNGARIGVTVLGVLAVLFSLLSFVNNPALVSVVVAAYTAIAVVLFWVGRANDWYRAKKAAR